jgi:hypothetical protein
VPAGASVAADGVLDHLLDHLVEELVAPRTHQRIGRSASMDDGGSILRRTGPGTNSMARCRTAR